MGASAQIVGETAEKVTLKGLDDLSVIRHTGGSRNRTTNNQDPAIS
jgi:hypothetical protein